MNENGIEKSEKQNVSIILQLPEYVSAYSSRLSLCVIDVIRRLQQLPSFEKGVEKFHIIENIKKLPNVDGDISSQVSIALHDLEMNGLIMHMKQGYKTIGPFAKLCMAKTPRQRRILWRKLDMKYNHSYTDLPSTVNSSSAICNRNGGVGGGDGKAGSSCSGAGDMGNGENALRCLRSRSVINLISLTTKNDINQDN